MLPAAAYADGRSNKDGEIDRRKFAEVREYLLNGGYPVNSSKSDKLVVRRCAKDFQIVDGQLPFH